MVVLPLYATTLGASKSVSGLSLSICFVCVTLGNAMPAMLPRNFVHRRLLLVACGIPLVALMGLCGFVTTVIQLTVVTGLIWFLCGVFFSQTATLVGLAAPERERGTAFGTLGVTQGIGTVISGASLGYLHDRFGYRMMFLCVAAFCTLTIVGSLLCTEPRVSPSPAAGREPTAPARRIGFLLVLLFAAQLLIAVTNGPANLGRSFIMSEAKFSETAITLTVAVGGLLSLGLPLVLGWLSDRLGRRWILIASCIPQAAGLLLLGFSQLLWQFCVVSLLSTFMIIPGTLGPSLVVDLDASGNVGRSVSLYGAMSWIGSIVGMAATGYALERLGAFTSMAASSLLPLAAAALLLFVKPKVRPASPVSLRRAASSIARS